MNAVSAVLRTMTESGPRPEVVPLLQMVLPGIDPNDKHKTMCTFVLIDRLADMITFIDCSSDADNPELTEVRFGRRTGLRLGGVKPSRSSFGRGASFAVQRAPVRDA